MCRMESVELPLVIRKFSWPVVVSLIGAIAAAVLLFAVPGIYSNPLQFGLAYGFCVIAGSCIMFLMSGKPELVVSDEGIHASHWGVELILWSELEDVCVRGSTDGDYLCLSLRQPEEYRAKGYLAKIANTACREAGFGDLMIKPADVGLEASEFLHFIRRQIARSRSEPKKSPSSVRYRMPKD